MCPRINPGCYSVTASRPWTPQLPFWYHLCHVRQSSVSYAPAEGQKEYSFAVIPAEQGEGRSPGGESEEVNPPGHIHRTFPSLGTHWVDAQHGFQGWEHTLPQTATPLPPFPSVLEQTPCPMMSMNPLPRVPLSQDFHRLQYIRHIWCQP